jgi:hypothetical protein
VLNRNPQPATRNSQQKIQHTGCKRLMSMLFS